MAPTTFRSLQDRHEALLQKQQNLSKENQQDFTKEVKEYIEEAKRGGSYISSNRERDQLRANLRYWANYIYSIDGIFPDTELAPSSVQSKPFPMASVVAIAVLGLVLVFAGVRFLSSGRGSSTEPTETPFSISPSLAPATEAPVPTQTSEPVLATETPVSLPIGLDVVISSPAAGEKVAPVVAIKGIYTNLTSGSTIHIILIKDDLFFPLKNYYIVPEGSTEGNWEIDATLYQDPSELKQGERYMIAPAVCHDNDCLELLSNRDSLENGISADSLLPPDSLTLYRDASKLIYRNAYKPVQGMRLVYSKFDGNSYDLYTSNPDGSDEIQITNTDDIDEESPKLSPDGTKIVYERLIQSTNTHLIHIMDSNGQNDQEIRNGADNLLNLPDSEWSPNSRNVLELPDWSSDSKYISYALGNTSQPSVTYWSIRVYDLSTGKDIKTKISEKSGPHILHRYHSWFPDSNDIVFNTLIAGTSGLVRAPLNSLEAPSLFFDNPVQVDEVQPSIGKVDNGYILTYTVIDSKSFSHSIYAVLSSGGEVPPLGTPIRLTRDPGGADYPILEPDSKTIYYVREGNIYKLEFSVEGGKIILSRGPNQEDGEYYGDLIVETGQVSENPSFDINNMDAYFPIQ